MRKLFVSLLSLLLTISLLNTTCPHVHDENCGFDKTTETGCSHECDDSCYEIDPHLGTGGPGGDHD